MKYVKRNYDEVLADNFIESLASLYSIRKIVLKGGPLDGLIDFEEYEGNPAEPKLLWVERSWMHNAVRYAYDHSDVERNAIIYVHA